MGLKKSLLSFDFWTWGLKSGVSFILYFHDILTGLLLGKEEKLADTDSVILNGLQMYLQITKSSKYEAKKLQM